MLAKIPAHLSFIVGKTRKTMVQLYIVRGGIK